MAEYEGRKAEKALDGLAFQRPVVSGGRREALTGRARKSRNYFGR